MRSGIARLVRRYPLGTFFLLACVCSWWPWPLYAAGLAPAPIAGFGPFLAALVVLPLTHGRAGLGTLLRRMVRWRVGVGWYAAALLIPVAISLTAAGLNLRLGAQVPAAAALAGWPGLVVTFLVLLLVPGLGGSWEEPGFRGYAQPRLQAGRPALVASLILGTLWIGWHLPLFLTGNIHWSDVVFIPAFAVVLTWVFNSTGGSVLLVMLSHNMNNTISGAFVGQMFAGADSVRQSWLYAALWCLVALAVVVVAGPARLCRRGPIPTLDAVRPGTSPADSAPPPSGPQGAAAPAPAA
jgi:membrane protease YdiL (CAAX protease family)